MRYAYTLDNSGWDPVYDLDARPEEGIVRVLLTARLRQNSGMDWRGCDLSIVWQDARPLDAPALPVWRVDEGPVPRPYARAAAEFKSAPVMLADSAAGAPAAPVPVLDKGTYARWDLGRVTLPQGQEHLVLRQEEWKAPLQWVARPDGQGSPVWLMVERVLDSTPWPSAQAEFSVDGLPVGSGRFVPEGNRVRLYFGWTPGVGDHHHGRQAPWRDQDHRQAPDLELELDLYGAQCACPGRDGARGAPRAPAGQQVRGRVAGWYPAAEGRGPQPVLEGGGARGREPQHQPRRERQRTGRAGPEPCGTVMLFFDVMPFPPSGRQKGRRQGRHPAFFRSRPGCPPGGKREGKASVHAWRAGMVCRGKAGAFL